MRSQLGGHIRESMAASAPTGVGGPLPTPASGASGQYQGITRPKDALTIEIARLVPDPGQPRKEFDHEALDHLAASLKARGQLQPIRVRWDEAVARWIIVAGERRYRAALLAGFSTMMCVEAKGTLSADDILEDQLVENCVREDLRPIEQARAFKALIDRRGCSGRQLAETLNISHMAVSRALALLDLPSQVQEHVEQGTLAPSVAYEVSKLDDEEAQSNVASRAVAEGMNRAEVVEAVRRAKASKGRGGKAKSQPPVTDRPQRAGNGVKISISSTPRHSLQDVAAALREIADRILSGSAQEAA